MTSTATPASDLHHAYVAAINPNDTGRNGGADMAKLPFWSAAAFFLAPLAASANSSTTLEQQVVEDDQINYVTGDPATWPIELEATIAAPDNHKILLENERVRVLEVTLGPGEVEPLHFHRWPSVLHIMQADEWIDRDAHGNVIFDSRAGPSLELPLTMWKGPEAPILQST